MKEYTCNTFSDMPDIILFVCKKEDVLKSAAWNALVT